MFNPFSTFLGLLPAEEAQIGTVAAISEGVAMVSLPGGQSISARGVATAGDKVFVKGDQIQGVAPDLPLIAVSI